MARVEPPREKAKMQPCIESNWVPPALLQATINCRPHQLNKNFRVGTYLSLPSQCSKDAALGPKVRFCLNHSTKIVETMPSYTVGVATLCIGGKGSKKICIRWIGTIAAPTTLQCTPLSQCVGMTQQERVRGVWLARCFFQGAKARAGPLSLPSPAGSGKVLGSPQFFSACDPCCCNALQRFFFSSNLVRIFAILKLYEQSEYKSATLKVSFFLYWS